MFNSPNLTDAFFSPGSEAKPEIKEIALTRLDPYQNQPFKLYSYSKLKELAEDIKVNGLLNPIIVRPHGKGRYQIIAGHNRVNAFISNGESMIPAIIKEMDDQAAAIALVNSNLNQRQEITPGEKAKAYKMRHDAIKSQGVKGAGNSLDKLSEDSADSGRTIARYIRVNNLIPGLFERFDEGKLSLSVAEKLTVLEPEAQQLVDDYLEVSNKRLTDKLAKNILEQKTLTSEGLKKALEHPSKGVPSTDYVGLYADYNQRKKDVNEDVFLSVIEFLKEKGILK